MIVETVLAVVLLLLGVAMGALSIAGFGKSVLQILRWDSAVGKVIGFHREEGAHWPKVRFTTHTGHTTEFTSQSGRGTREYREGDSVLVLYNPNSPEKAEIKSFVRLWLFPIGLAIFSAIFILGTLHQWPTNAG